LIWGDFEPVWESEEDFSEILMLLMRHMNGIVQTLMEDPEDFEPLYLEHIMNDESYTIVDEWCEGYYRGVELSSEAWLDDEEMAILLAPIFAFTEATEWSGHNFTDEEVKSIQQAIAPSAREIHAYWLQQRADMPPQDSPIINTEPKIGRNDPCPCGSGKKFKKCCLH
jgi:uncharacterized protein